MTNKEKRLTLLADTLYIYIYILADTLYLVFEYVYLQDLIQLGFIKELRMTGLHTLELNGHFLSVSNVNA